MNKHSKNRLIGQSIPVMQYGLNGFFVRLWDLQRFLSVINKAAHAVAFAWYHLDHKLAFNPVFFGKSIHMRIDFLKIAESPF